MKSLQQLLDKLDEEKTGFESIFDFYDNDLLQFIPFDTAKQYMKPETTKEEWEMYYRPLKRGNVIGCMEEYMKFAWEKCLSSRGLSSCRSLAHYKAWLWILEDQETIDFLDDEGNYPCFGAPILQYICNKYNWDFKDLIEPWQLETATKFIDGKGC